jgi:hypothetical protein
MEYYRNLLKNNQKSLFRLILGILLVIGSIYIIADRIVDKGSIRAFDWSFSAIFALNGLMHIFLGLGTTIERFFGKAFIEIDTNTINIKLGVFKKAQRIDWQDIQVIGFAPHSFNFQMKDGSTQLLPVTKLDDLCISDVKKILSEIADTKKIKYYIQPYMDGVHYAPPLRSKKLEV